MYDLLDTPLFEDTEGEDDESLFDPIPEDSDEGGVELSDDETEDDEPPSLDEEPPELEDESNEEPSESEEEDINEVEESPETKSAPTTSLPKQTDAEENDKNGVRRKKLYIAFIEWSKEFKSKNTFGSVFDKDAFHDNYTFIPHEMRYFYRLANPMMCVLSGSLTFFALAEIKKINSGNKQFPEILIFAATPQDYRVFNTKDSKVYRATDNNGSIVLGDELSPTFDLYIQTMIDKGEILNGPLEESVYNEGFISKVRDMFTRKPVSTNTTTISQAEKDRQSDEKAMRLWYDGEDAPGPYYDSLIDQGWDTCCNIIFGKRHVDTKSLTSRIGGNPVSLPGMTLKGDFIGILKLEELPYNPMGIKSGIMVLWTVWPDDQDTGPNILYIHPSDYDKIIFDDIDIHPDSEVLLKPNTASSMDFVRVPITKNPWLSTYQCSDSNVFGLYESRQYFSSPEGNFINDINWYNLICLADDGDIFHWGDGGIACWVIPKNVANAPINKSGFITSRHDADCY